MIILTKLRNCALFSIFALMMLCLPRISSGQPGTLEIRDSDVQRNQQFNEGLAPVASQQVDPKLWQILKDWEQTTKVYKKLSGTHRRFVYDSVFQVEKRADGSFYYEAPDKGRIDIEEVNIPAGAKSQKLNKQGKPYSLQSDIPEIWICDGKRIAQAIVAQKQYQVHNIPAGDQGINIMDGPLPFLFGLPADKAIERYHFELLPQTDQKMVWLKVLPKRKQDAANWREAEVILDRKRYLPVAVKLINPPGTTETVYSFKDLKDNENVFVSKIFGRGNPFEISKVLNGYKEIKQAQSGPGMGPGQAPPGVQPQPRPQPQAPIAGQPKQLTMPQVVNYPWKEVQKLFQDRGFEVEFRKSGPAPEEELVFKVAKQEPVAGTALKSGQKVIFFLYEEVKAASRP
ncbi:MAG: PASTA domain-containing protein [Planctomycetaceae bacterium]|nr:PASTA domain-containing protein [Planctomycetaceae bacterium]